MVSIVRARMLLLSLILAATCCLPVSGVSVRHTAKPRKLSFRIVAEAEKLPRSGFSMNRDVYVAEIVDKHGAVRSAKVVYRYLGYEDDLPDEMLSYDQVHTFVARRDPSCDEAFQPLSTKLVPMPDGRLSAVGILRYTVSKSSADFSDDEVLPCYVIGPRNYRGSRTVKAPPATVQTAHGE